MEIPADVVQRVVQSAPDAPKETVKDAPKETVKEAPKNESVDAPKIASGDILKRTSPVKTDATQDVPKETNYREDLERITDPAVRAIAEKQLKDL